MARIGDGGDLLKCSFCGKSQKQVVKLIAGPGVYICNECIELCNEIIEEELGEESEVGLDELPKPREIFEFLNAYVIGQETAKKSLAVITSRGRDGKARGFGGEQSHEPMLAGLVEGDEGDATVPGYEVRAQKAQARPELGHAHDAARVRRQRPRRRCARRRRRVACRDPRRAVRRRRRRGS